MTQKEKGYVGLGVMLVLAAGTVLGSEPLYKAIDSIAAGSVSYEAGTYTGTSEGTAQITVDMHKVERVTALKYQGSALDKVSVEVSQDGSNWIKVKSDFTGLTGAGEKTVWFDSLTEDEDS